MSRRMAFMDALVPAVMDGSKTVTRRLTAPRLAPGDVVDVCEALVPWPTPKPGDAAVTVYRADGAVVLRPHTDGTTWTHPWGWKPRVLPARYCPGWAVRTRLEILDVRPEFLTAIDEADAIREGVVRLCMDPSGEFFRVKRKGEPDIVTSSGRGAFLAAFREIHDLDDDDNPDVWRIEFRRVEA